MASDSTDATGTAATATTSGSALGAWWRRGGWRAVAGAAVGAAGLAAYAHFVGCHTGTCALTSDVRTATIFGGLIGLVAGWPGPPAGRPPAQR